MAKQVCPTPGFARLMLATDGSAYSRAAVDEAIRIAANCSGTLFVIMIIETTAEVEMWDSLAAEKIEKRMRRYLDGVQAKASQQGVACEVIMHYGDKPYQEIVSEAKTKKVDTIIMGSHGRTGLSRLMMGSVVSRVIGHAPCKVLVVPPRKK